MFTDEMLWRVPRRRFSPCEPNFSSRLCSPRLPGMPGIPKATNLQVFLSQIRPNLFKTLKGKLASSFSLQFRYLGFAYSICALPLRCGFCNVNLWSNKRHLKLVHPCVNEIFNRFRYRAVLKSIARDDWENQKAGDLNLRLHRKWIDGIRTRKHLIHGFHENLILSSN